MKKFLFSLILVLFLTSCKDCSKPTVDVCVEWETQTIMTYNVALKMMFPTTISECVKYETIPNECYKGEK